MPAADRSGRCPQIASMATLDEVHVRRKRGAISGPQNQVEVCVNQVIAVNLDGILLASFTKKREKGRVVNILRENTSSIVAAVDNMKRAT